MVTVVSTFSRERHNLVNSYTFLKELLIDYFVKCITYFCNEYFISTKRFNLYSKITDQGIKFDALIILLALNKHLELISSLKTSFNNGVVTAFFSSVH